MGLGLSNPLHIAIIVLVVVLVFGSKRLPELGRSLGEGMRGFKDSIQGHDEPEQAPQPPALTQATAVGPAPAPQPPQEPQPAPVETPAAPRSDGA